MDVYMTPAFKERILIAIAPLEGWCTLEKASAMAELILTEHPSRVVEIGVFGGRSLIPQAMALRENGTGIIVGIDPWRHVHAVEGNLSDADKKWWTNNVDLEGIHRGCMKALWDNGLDDFCIILRAASQHCPMLFGGGIDILHIDGTHSEEASIRDVNLYLPQVGRGGYVWFDDVDWTTTAKAVGVLDAACDRVDTVGSCVLFKRR